MISIETTTTHIRETRADITPAEMTALIAKAVCDRASIRYKSTVPLPDAIVTFNDTANGMAAHVLLTEDLSPFSTPVEG